MWENSSKKLWNHTQFGEVKGKYYLLIAVQFIDMYYNNYNNWYYQQYIPNCFFVFSFLICLFAFFILDGNRQSYHSYSWWVWWAKFGE